MKEGLLFKYALSLIVVLGFFLVLTSYEELYAQKVFYMNSYLVKAQNQESLVSNYNYLFNEYNHLTDEFSSVVDKYNSSIVLLQGTKTDLENSKSRVSSFVSEGNVVVELENDFFKVNFTDTGSMRPMIGENTVCYFQKVVVNDLVVGDVIAYTHGEGNVSHRIVFVGFDESGWFAQTKGDNNFVNDDYLVRESDVLGVLAVCTY